MQKNFAIIKVTFTDLKGCVPCGTRTHVGRLGGNCSIQLS